MAFVKRLITVTLGGDTLSGLRISCHIDNAGQPSPATANVRIYGMTISHMNKYSTLGQAVKAITPSPITISAGDTQTGLTQIFSGLVQTAVSDFQGGPNLPFHITATSTGEAQGTTQKPTSYNQANVPISTVLQTLAGKANLTLENNGVNTQLSYPYFWGSLWNQIKTCCIGAGVGYTVENGVLAIWPPAKGRNGNNRTISPTTGMVGYPAALNNGIKIKVLWSIPMYRLADPITIQGSAISRANGSKWIINRVDLDLETLKPNGQWFATLELTSTEPGTPPALPSSGG